MSKAGTAARRRHETDKRLHIRDDFPEPSLRDWAEAFLGRASDLPENAGKGIADLMTDLSSETEDGLRVYPLYTSGSVVNAPRYGIETLNCRAGWTVAQEISAGSPQECASQLSEHLKSGVTVANLVPGDSYRPGVAIRTLADLQATLQPLQPNKHEVFLHAYSQGPSHLALLAALAGERNIELSGLAGAVAADPLGELYLRGQLDHAVERSMDELALMTEWVEQNTPLLSTVWVHGEIWEQAGLSGTDQLAALLITGVAYLRALDERGIAPEKAARHFRFSLGLDQRVFASIARVRAARMLWDRVLQGCDVPLESRFMYLHTRTGKYNRTVYDAHNNMLRGALEAFAAVLGGADSLHVGSYDDHSQPSEVFSRRIARNTQHILTGEAHLSRVVDPAAGSWYIDQLADQMTSKVWDTFCQVEKDGGCMKCLVQDRLDQYLPSYEQRLAQSEETWKRPVVGVTTHPNEHDSPLLIAESPRPPVEPVRRSDSLSVSATIEDAIKAARTGATVSEISSLFRQDAGESPRVRPLPIGRRTERLERLRRAVEEYRATYETRTVLLTAPEQLTAAAVQLRQALSSVGVFDCEVRTPSDTGDLARLAEENPGALHIVLINAATLPHWKDVLTTRAYKPAPGITTVIIVIDMDKAELVPLADSPHMSIYTWSGPTDEIVTGLLRYLGVPV